jgi:hypothetical protein
VRATTIRFSDPIYQRLDQASQYTGLPINAIVTTACLDWLRLQFPASASIDLPVEPENPSVFETLRQGRGRDRLPPLSSDARGAFLRAQDEARRRNHEAVGTEHLLLGIVADEASTGGQALRDLGIDARQLREATDFIIGRDPQRANYDPRLSPRAGAAIHRAGEEARRRQESEIDTGHLLLGICGEEESVALRILESLGVDADGLRACVEALLPPAP